MSISAVKLVVLTQESVGSDSLFLEPASLKICSFFGFIS